MVDVQIVLRYTVVFSCRNSKCLRLDNGGTRTIGELDGDGGLVDSVGLSDVSSDRQLRGKV